MKVAKVSCFVDECSGAKVDQLNLICGQIDQYVFIFDVAMQHAELENGHSCLYNLLEVFTREPLFESVDAQLTHARVGVSGIGEFGDQVEQILRSLQALHDYDKTTLLLKIVKDAYAVLARAHSDHERDFERNTLRNNRTVVNVRSRIIRLIAGRAAALVPLSYFRFFDDFDGDWFAVCTSHATKYGSKAALADLVAESVVLIEDVSDLSFAKTLIDVGGELQVGVGFRAAVGELGGLVATGRRVCR